MRAPVSDVDASQLTFEDSLRRRPQALIGIVALIHLYIVVPEMLWWGRPPGRKAFGLTAELSAATKVMAANQGLYNGSLAAGLIWALWLGAAGGDGDRRAPVDLRRHRPDGRQQRARPMLRPAASAAPAPPVRMTPGSAR